MKLIRSIKGRYRGWQQRSAQRRLLRGYSAPAAEITRSQWDDSLKDPTAFYLRCFHYFHTRLPEPLRAHRAYFENDGRGFGEKSFHVMWFLLFREFSPQSFLEIGVFRGQTIKSRGPARTTFPTRLFHPGHLTFFPAGDAVSKYRRDVDYYDDTLKNCAHFSLPVPALLKAYSTDETARKLVSSRNWSFIYIDGNHDYEVARADWDLCAAHLQPGGLIVLDDSGLTTKYAPPIFATGGHPGPSRLAQEVDRTRFREVLQVGTTGSFRRLPREESPS